MKQYLWSLNCVVLGIKVLLCDSVLVQAAFGAISGADEGRHGSVDSYTSSGPGYRPGATPPLTRRHRPIADTATQGARGSHGGPASALAAAGRRGASTGRRGHVAAAGPGRACAAARQDRHQPGGRSAPGKTLAQTTHGAGV